MAAPKVAEPRSYTRNKSWSREVASGMLLLLLILICAYLYSGAEAYYRVMEYITPFVFIFAGGAFGVKAMLSQSVEGQGK